MSWIFCFVYILSTKILYFSVPVFHCGRRGDPCLGSRLSWLHGQSSIVGSEVVFLPKEPNLTWWQMLLKGTSAVTTHWCEIVGFKFWISILKLTNMWKESFSVPKSQVWISPVFTFEFPGCCHFEFLWHQMVATIVAYKRKLLCNNSGNHLTS